MKVTVIGSGYVGLVTGACLADLGNQVFCLDLDHRKIDMLNQGQVPIYEPGLSEMIARNRLANRLVFSTDIKASVEHGDIQYIAVGTPPDEDGSADMKYVLAAAKNIAQYMTSFKVVINKSTVPVSTADRVKTLIQNQLANRGLNINFAVVSNPEFLKEGAAIEDFMRPDRIVIGTYPDTSGQVAKDLLTKLYAPFNRHHERTYWMDVRSAELTKYAANAMLATRISFMNELANMADAVGADIEAVRQGIGSDSRIGYGFLYAGTGYGGSCFPKDVQALIKTAEEHGQQLNVLSAVELSNQKQKKVLVKKIMNEFGHDLQGKCFAIWGLAFKPNTDDMRAAPSREIIQALVMAGAHVQVYDPVAIEEAKHALSLDFSHQPDMLKRINYVNSMYDVLNQADALVIVTEWKEFRSPDFSRVTQQLKSPRIFDGRNLYEPAEMKALGIQYQGIGRA